MSLKNRWRLFKLRTKLNLKYFWFGFTHPFEFNEVKYLKMVENLEEDVNKYWRIKFKLEQKEHYE